MHEPTNTKRPDYVAEYLGEWANPRNELHKVNTSIARLRRGLSAERGDLYAGASDSQSQRGDIR